MRRSMVIHGGNESEANLANAARLLAFAAVFCLLCCGCGERETQRKGAAGQETGQNGNTAEDLMREVREGRGEAAEYETTEAPEEILYADATDFAVELLKGNMAGKNGDNVMVAPLSVMTALAMTANGAQGDTLNQMLSALGENQDMDSWNRNLKAWAEGFASMEETKLDIANSVWFRDDEQLALEKGFLERNAFYYDADIYQMPFRGDALGNINAWVEEKTGGKVKNILDKIDEDAVMYLVNTVVFDAKWMRPYEEYQVSEGSFTNAMGEKEKVFYMYATQSTYIEDENAVGFVKPYKEGFCFVAIKPEEGISPEEYMESMDGEHFRELLSEAKTEVIVETGLPKFEAEYEADLGGILSGLGMEDAFNRERADFRGMGAIPDKNIYISKVIHRTCISVGELGTEALAATVEECVAEAAEEPDMEIYYVYLRSPFVYAIVENETNVPVFIGILNTVDG